MFTAKKLFSFFDYFVTAHAIITKIIGLVYLIGKIILISKTNIFHDFCGCLDQIRLQKMVRTACYPYTETMLYDFLGGCWLIGWLVGCHAGGCPPFF